MRRIALPLAFLLVAGTALAGDKDLVINETFPSRPGKVVLIDAGALDLSVRAADIGEIRVHAELGAGSFKASQSKAWIDAHRQPQSGHRGRTHLRANPAR